jgi:acetyltransferase-like isoleucine patch superfamily enzyme
MKGDRLENAVIGPGTVVEEGVQVGWRYHPGCGPARIGGHGILRAGTIVYGDVEIGDHFQSGHHAVIRAKVRIGHSCTLLNQVVLEGIVRMGDGVRLMTQVYVPSRTWFGDDIFVGPGTVFLNDRLPGRWPAEPAPTPQGATVEDDVMIGGGCVILPGITIGRGSFVAAGSVVTKDVPPRSFAMGSPVRITSLPAALDRPNARSLTRQPVDLWHPRTPYADLPEWPAGWGPR